MSAIKDRPANDLPTNDRPIPLVIQRLLALAACAALAVGYFSQSVFWTAPPITSQQPRNEASIPEHASLAPAMLVEKAMLLQEMERVFDQQLQWVVETDHQVKLGTAPAADAKLRPNSVPLVVRLVVERRETNDTSWRPAYTVDVVTRSEQLVNVERMADGLALSMWAYALPDGMIAVDARLQGRDLDGATTAILANGQPKKVGSTQSNGAEYRVFQTAFAL